METTPIRDGSKKKKRNIFLLIIPWIGTALFIVTLAVGAYFYAAKKPITVLTPSNASVTVIVCGDDIVSSYNTASKLQARGANNDISSDADGLNKLDGQIRSLSGFDQDPTCQTMLFWNAIMDSDSGKATIALTAIKNLHGTHHYADSNLENTTSISVMKDSLNAMITAHKA